MSPPTVISSACPLVASAADVSCCMALSAGQSPRKMYSDRCPRPMAFAKVVRNQMVPSRAE